MRHLLIVLSVLIFVGCSSELVRYSYPKPVDTHEKEVLILDDKIFETPSGVRAAADFPSARLQEFSESGVDTFIAIIPAENTPINSSPWYAFSLAASQKREVTIQLTFPEGVGNRYLPKTASNRGGPWSYVPFDRVDTIGNKAFIRLEVGPQKTYLAGQELIATDSIATWISKLRSTPSPKIITIGKSKLGRPIWAIELGNGKKDLRPTVVFLSRQHPPEVSGFIAFQAFFSRLLEQDALAVGFRQNFRILAIPVINPDGVDEGHWRHNAGGVDLNRDWAAYRQPETSVVVEWLQEYTLKDQVQWGMDFHSTQYDVLYTHDPELVDFRNADKLATWLVGLENWAAENYAGASAKPEFDPLGRPLVIGQDTLRVEPEGIGRPTSASWFAMHYGCVGVTYEVGDEQDRAYIKAKARKAAELLMETL